MKRLFHAVVVCLLLSAPVFSQSAGIVDEAGNVVLKDMKFMVPQGWTLFQNALSESTILVGFSKGNDLVNLYVDPKQTPDLKEIFGFGAKIVSESTGEKLGPFQWRTLTTSKATGGVTYYVKGFLTQFNGNVYFGYSRSTDRTIAEANASAFLDNVIVPLRSLTGPDYTGKKYYFGWGAAGSGDPSMMQNEVKYDVLHTHDIFTKEIGGGYIGSTLIGSSTSGSQIRAKWKEIGEKLTAEDMYVQYSSGHGSQSGLGVGVSYNEIRDNALAYKAKEIIIYIMACYSGNLVEGFNANKAVWENWQAQGRTLMVMASSRKSETSSTGPGTDPDQPGGPNGSAGSAFGHALWKSLIGYADGHVDGVKDGFLSLGEIRDFSVFKTKEVGGHTPVHTGAYNTGLIMNKKPSKAFLERLEGGTDNLTDDEIMQRIQELDQAMRVSNG